VIEEGTQFKFLYARLLIEATLLADSAQMADSRPYWRL
jgi:hypothetical protein